MDTESLSEGIENVATIATAAAAAASSTVSETASSSIPDLKHALNLSQYVPSAKGLLLAGPRIVTKFNSIIENHYRPSPAAAPDLAANQVAATIAEGTQAVAGASASQRPGLASSITMEGGRSLSNMFAYATSKWSLACIIMTVIVNRTQVYAATRRHIELGARTRTLLRMVPILFLAYHARMLSLSLQCQTSPVFNDYRWPGRPMQSAKYTGDGHWLHDVTYIMNLGAPDIAACQAAQMVPQLKPDERGEDIEIDQQKLRGSLSRLWPFFRSLCSSHFVEVLTSAIEGRMLRTEVGLNLFEHSLAFAEAEAGISSSFGWGPFGGPNTTVEKVSDDQASESEVEGTDTAKEGEAEDEVQESIRRREKILLKVNTSPEVLFVSLLSALNHITSHMLAIFKRQNDLRLLSTGIFGMLYLGLIAHSFFTFSLTNPSSQSLLRIPTVCIIGFVPHAMILAGIMFCAFIYCLAVLLSVLAVPRQIRAQHGSFWANVKVAHNNMQVSTPLTSIRINPQSDFYTAVLRVGLSSLAMASEAVYLNEATQVTIRPRTWLEDDRMREIERMGARWPGFSTDDHVDGSKLAVVNGDSIATSGYARERAPDASQAKRQDKIFRGGIGAMERSGRMIMAFDYLFGIAKLLVSWIAVMVFGILARLGIRWRPSWLAWLVKEKIHDHKISAESNAETPQLREFWLVDKDGKLVLPPNDEVDVEKEMKKRLMDEATEWSKGDDQELDRNIYSWFLSGGWFGTADGSGSFEPEEKELDDDLTSVISEADSIATTHGYDGWESDSDGNDDGRRTPTQRSPQFSRESTPAADTALSMSDLTRLLNPQTPQQRDEARALSAHLASNTIMTRSRYRQAALLEKASVLTSTNIRPPHLQKSWKLSPDEEAELLQHLIIARRSQAAAVNQVGSAPNAVAGPANTGAWSEQQTEEASGGPQCAVCQTSPRSIIVWPCRCLSLCDGCRVDLAMRNFNTCVCCRSEVGSFSKIFVP